MAYKLDLQNMKIKQDVRVGRLAVGAKLKKLREEKGFTQGQIAEATGLTLPTIVNIEKAKVSFRVDSVHAILYVLDAKLSDLEWKQLK